MANPQTFFINYVTALFLLTRPTVRCFINITLGVKLRITIFSDWRLLFLDEFIYLHKELFCLKQHKKLLTYRKTIYNSICIIVCMYLSSICIHFLPLYSQNPATIHVSMIQFCKNINWNYTSV